MQLYTYLFPSVVSIPRGYSCSLAIPFRLVANRLHRDDAEISAIWTVISEGKELMRRELSFGKPERGRPPKPELVFDWHADEQGAADVAVFAEVEITSRAQVPCFSNRRPVVSYSLGWKPGCKSVLCSSAYKYGSPQIILMMADFGDFVEGFPAIHIDRGRDISQSLVFINPYLKPIVVDVVTSDKVALPRIKIPARSVRYCNLATVLRPGEDRWLGQLQLRASNRLITYVYKHSFDDPTLISDQEHMDPYRSDPTHYPLTQQWRLLFGEMMRRRRARA